MTDLTAEQAEELRKCHELFYRAMPEGERELAIIGLKALGLPSNEEFLVAYTLGVARGLRKADDVIVMRAEDDAERPAA